MMVYYVLHIIVDVQCRTNLQYQTRSHGSARTSVGHSAVQHILNKYNVTVGKAQPTKQRAGDETSITESNQQLTYISPELVFNLDETQLSSTYKVIKSSCHCNDVLY